MFFVLTEEEVCGGVRRHVDHGCRGLALFGGVHAGDLGHEAQDARRLRDAGVAKVQDGDVSEGSVLKSKFTRFMCNLLPFQLILRHFSSV